MSAMAGHENMYRAGRSGRLRGGFGLFVGAIRRMASEKYLGRRAASCQGAGRISGAMMKTVGNTGFFRHLRRVTRVSFGAKTSLWALSPYPKNMAKP